MIKKLSVAVAAYFCFVLTAQARTYYLPDYQMSFGNRSSQSDTSTTHTPTCSAYGYYTADSRPSNADCTKVSIPGLTCYSCTICASSFSYNSSNCSGEYVLSGNSCGGKYNKCICDPAKYTTSADGSGCAEGEIIDTSKSCTNKTDGKTLYQCVTDPCYGLADNETELGCDKYYDQCPSKCELGSTCKVADCSAYTLASCPSGKTCETCTPGCGDNAPRYKESCTPKNCSGYTLASCPTGSTCITCTPGCGDTAKRYKEFKGLAFQVNSPANGHIFFTIVATNAQIDWGDGTIDSIDDDPRTFIPVTHTYTTAGLYDIEISGKVSDFMARSSSTTVKPQKLYSLNLPGIQSISFYEFCSTLSGSIPPLPEGLTDGGEMFKGCRALTGNIPKLPSTLTDGHSMFHNCNNLTGNIPQLPEGLINGTSMFYNCRGLTGDIPALPDSLGVGYYMFYNCSGLTGSIPALPDGLTNGQSMFYGCSSLTGQTPIKPSKLTSYTDIFYATKVTNDGSWPADAW